MNKPHEIKKYIYELDLPTAIFVCQRMSDMSYNEISPLRLQTKPDELAAEIYLNSQMAFQIYDPKVFKKVKQLQAGVICGIQTTSPGVANTWFITTKDISPRCWAVATNQRLSPVAKTVKIIICLET